MSIKTLENFTPTTGFYNIKDKLWAHIYKRADKLFRKAEDARKNIKTKEEFETYIEEKRLKFIDAMGGIPYDGKKPLNAHITGTIEEENLTVENIIYESRENVYVTANLYIPKKRKTPCGDGVYCSIKIIILQVACQLQERGCSPQLEHR